MMATSTAITFYVYRHDRPPLTWAAARGQTFGVDRARRHHRLLALLAFGLLALVAELLGRSLTERIDVGRHVATPAYSGADYYPVLLIAVKVGVALLLARLAWRFAKARATARAARRVAAALAVRPHRTAPRVRLELSPRLWLASFLVTAGIFLVQSDAEGVASGRWYLLAPWLHTSALPVFAVLSVVVAVVWRGVAGWLSDYETYAREAAAYVDRLVRRVARVVPRRSRSADARPRRLFGLAFESRPPPAPA